MVMRATGRAGVVVRVRRIRGPLRGVVKGRRRKGVRRRSIFSRVGGRRGGGLVKLVVVEMEGGFGWGCCVVDWPVWDVGSRFERRQASRDIRALTNQLSALFVAKYLIHPPQREDFLRFKVNERVVGLLSLLVYLILLLLCPG